MNYILKVILVFTALLIPHAHAEMTTPPKSVEEAYLSAVNKLKNPGWELGKTQWTASGGTYTVTSTAANVFAGARAGSWDSSGASQTFTSASFSITSGGGYGNQNGAGQCRIQTPSGTATHKLQAYDGTNVLNEVTVTSSTAYQPATVNFIYPASGSVSLRLISVASDEPTIYIDDCFIGLADRFNIGSVSQAQFVGQSYFATTASCIWSRTNTALGAFSTDADCPGPTIEVQKVGTWATTDADLPQQTISNLPPGLYAVEVTGMIANTGSNYTCIAVSDGTTTSGNSCARPETGATVLLNVKATGYFEYTSSASRTFSVYGSGAAGDSFLYNNASNARVQFTIYRFPTSAETAYQANLPVLPTVQRFTSGSGTYTKPAGVSYIRVRMAGGGGGGGGSGTTNGAASTNGGNTTFGTSLLTANGGTGGSNGTAQDGAGGTATVSSPAITVVAQTGGKGGNGGSHNGGVGAATPTVQGGDGGSNLFGGNGTGGGSTNGVSGSAGVTNTGGGGGGAYMPQVNSGVSGSGGGAGGYIDALIMNPSATYSYSVGAGGTGQAAGTSGSAGSNGGSGVIIVEEYYSSANAPLLVNSVTSNSTGAERIERAQVGSTGTITLESGDWINGSASVASAVYTITLTSGIFSAAPVCQAIIYGDTTNYNAVIESASTSTIKVRTFDTANAASASAFHLLCMGAR
jgi:hypothetical protein